MTTPNPAVDDAVRRIRQDGFTILEEVIPKSDIATVRDAVVAAQQRNHAESEAMKAAIRAKGHRVGVEGVVGVEGRAGSVLLYDSRMWHAVAPNRADADRVALIVRYAPWWLNLEPTRPGSPEHAAMVVDTGGKNYASPEVLPEAYAALPNQVKPPYRHWVADG